MTAAIEAARLRPIDVAKKLGRHPSAVTRWILRGTVLRDGSRLFLDAIRTPGGWKVAPTAVDEFLTKLTDDARGSKAAPKIDHAEHDLAEAALSAAGFD